MISFTRTTIVSLVEALLPDISLDPQYKQVVAADTAAFVTDSIGSMVFFLRIPVSILLLLFELSPLLLGRRRFSCLNASAQQHHCDRAGKWSLVKFNDLMKLVGSLSTLAWADHRLVRETIGFNWSPEVSQEC